MHKLDARTQLRLNKEQSVCMHASDRCDDQRVESDVVPVVRVCLR